MPIYTAEDKAAALVRARKQITDISAKTDLDDVSACEWYIDGYLQCLANEGGLTAAELEALQSELEAVVTKRRQVLLKKMA